jgi:hypothetical protein
VLARPRCYPFRLALLVSLQARSRLTSKVAAAEAAVAGSGAGRGMVGEWWGAVLRLLF